ncbi:hypothetical protein L210DRAFT_3502440 [Boletus edulis BED1]|uniref:Pre-mRNA-splicing factor CWC24 n=1 Tax=Boletus edulis BED1 TaxID=1328754 RepID=A0AAD4GHZ1_BOLED|nr:hypothetical protein L210DRAFT_3502440 [Boletus edulis BED1]
MSTIDEVKVPFFKKGKSRPTTTRRRSGSPEPPATSSTSASASSRAYTTSEVVLPKRKAAANLLGAGTKRTAAQRTENDADDDESTREGPDVKWTAAGSHINAVLDIIAGDEIEEVLAKRHRKEREERGEIEEEAPDGVYKGQKAYRSHLKKDKEVPKAMRIGPQSSMGTIRTVTIIDYQPDVCKDYKETGYCGFGDTCKFLHDRGTYLAGWQLDKLAENPKSRVEDVSDSDSEEDIPFACLVCRRPYTDPVVTRCGHYYCSSCAIKRYAKNPKCLACGAPTGGIFNRADKVIAKLKKTQSNESEDKETGNDNGAVEIEGLADQGNEGAPSEEEEGSEDEE